MQSAEKKEFEPLRGPVTLMELTKRWSIAADAEETAKREKESLRAQIEARGVSPGFRDDYLVIGERSEIEGFTVVYSIENKKLEKVLRAEKRLKDAYEPAKFSLSRVKAIAEVCEPVAKVLEEIKKKAPVFRRVSKAS